MDVDSPNSSSALTVRRKPPTASGNEPQPSGHQLSTLDIRSLVSKPNIEFSAPPTQTEDAFERTCNYGGFESPAAKENIGRELFNNEVGDGRGKLEKVEGLPLHSARHPPTNRDLNQILVPAGQECIGGQQQTNDGHSVQRLDPEIDSRNGSEEGHLGRPEEKNGRFKEHPLVENCSPSTNNLFSTHPGPSSERSHLLEAAPAVTKPRWPISHQPTDPDKQNKRKHQSQGDGTKKPWNAMSTRPRGTKRRSVKTERTTVLATNASISELKEKKKAVSCFAEHPDAETTRGTLDASVLISGKEEKEKRVPALAEHPETETTTETLDASVLISGKEEKEKRVPALAEHPETETTTDTLDASVLISGKEEKENTASRLERDRSISKQITSELVRFSSTTAFEYCRLLPQNPFPTSPISHNLSPFRYDGRTPTASLVPYFPQNPFQGGTIPHPCQPEKMNVNGGLDLEGI
ncbi:hypothetical protein BJ508DRAFT_381445 [Ascobolus immersus RN42]|uniref:Uncharacterized protein n=1 Tax=Ascobolus immersus RN42 TaxID=1160509 RepID=A0A3N4HKL0_ASCIM|nr:hypothetical protein BJ508DRAFT_381445 [Ascobolus immersus RN42]